MNIILIGNVLLKGWSRHTVRSSGLCHLHFQDEDFRDETKTHLRRNRVPLHWQRVQEEVEPHHKPANRPAGVAAQEEVVPDEANRPAEVAAQLQEVHEEQTMRVETQEALQVEIQSVGTNDMVEQHQQKKENDCIGMVDRSLPSATYPSGRELFSFLDEDADLSFLNYEPSLKRCTNCFTFEKMRF